MKILGFFLIITAMTIGLCSDYINPMSKKPFVVLAFCFFIVGIYALILENNCLKKGSMPKYENPPAPPKKCICNDIGKHSPGGRCEACHSKKFDSKGIKIPQIPKDRIGCSV